MTSDDTVTKIVEALAGGAARGELSFGAESLELRELVGQRIAKNSAWSMTLRGFIDDPDDHDLRASMEFILQRVTASDPLFLAQLSVLSDVGSQPVAHPSGLGSSVSIDVKGSKNRIGDVAGRDIQKNRVFKIGSGALLAILLVGGGSYTAYHATHGDSLRIRMESPRQNIEIQLSAARVSIPGLSIAIPKGWQSARLRRGTGTDELGVEVGREHCQAGWPKYMNPCWKGGVFVGKVRGSSPKNAADTFSPDAYNGLKPYVRKISVLRRQAITVDGYPAYLIEWYVTYSEPPNAIQDIVTVQTGPASKYASIPLPNGDSLDYANSRISFISVSVDDSSSAPPKSILRAVVASARVNS